MTLRKSEEPVNPENKSTAASQQSELSRNSPRTSYALAYKGPARRTRKWQGFAPPLLLWLYVFQ